MDRAIGAHAVAATMGRKVICGRYLHVSQSLRRLELLLRRDGQVSIMDLQDDTCARGGRRSVSKPRSSGSDRKDRYGTALNEGV